MNRIYYSICFAVFVAAFSVAAIAQPDPPDRNQFTDSGSRVDILAQTLNLTDEQKIQIMRINQMQRRQLRQAQENLKEARNAADKAIYSDELNEQEVEARIQDLAMAQAEILKIRMMSEVRVRSILSPEQLVKFRDLRARLAEQRRNAGDRPPPPQRRQDQPIQRRQNPPVRNNGTVQRGTPPPRP